MSTASENSESKSAAPAGPSSGGKPAAKSGHGSFTAYRETIESVLVAFILAFLFRAFVAEAFVIPTGSMAPTLMGAHKDTQCDHCGAWYQSTASYEFDPNTQALVDRLAIGSTCAECRAVNSFDLAENADHTTFSGDRILVSKFDYLFSSPQRWDVLVFKFPEDARLNYIKRLVGLPGEQLRIEGGDVYTRPDNNAAWTLARKPPHKVRAMLQIVSDTDHRPRDIVSKGWPSLWQPLPPAVPAMTNDWVLTHNESEWNAKLSSGKDATQTHWLRYYHKYLDEELWKAWAGGVEQPRINPLASTLVTDFLAYNTTQFTSRKQIFPNGRIRSDITTDNRAREAVDPTSIYFDGLTGLPQDGAHWVGDLAAEFDIEVQSESGVISLDLVEFGIHYRCNFDVASGKATLQALDGDKVTELFRDAAGKTAVTPEASGGPRGRGNYRVMMANVDDQIMVWVNDRILSFNHPTTFDSSEVRSGRDRRPHWTQTDPLDAAPIGIGGTGSDLVVKRAQVHRDIYYIAIRDRNYFCDFDSDAFNAVIDSIPDRALRDMLRADYRMNGNRADAGMPALSWWYAHPETWAQTDIFARRGSLEFELGPDQFFPMGDNSAASSDARAWFKHYVDRRFLIGKALLVFWPHPWMRPVPHPNIPRMGLIR